MRLALAQMSMVNDIDRNFNKSLQFLDLADEHKADLVFFPEVQLTPFFPQYQKKDVGGALNHIPSEFAIDVSDPRIWTMLDRCRQYGFYASPNFYVKDNGRFYDMSLWLAPDGSVSADAKMVHIASARNFYETDYYMPSEDGFFVYDTPFGKVGIVICYDRHLPESIATCAAKGADLVIIPAANVKTEPLEMYEWDSERHFYRNGKPRRRGGCAGLCGRIPRCRSEWECRGQGRRFTAVHCMQYRAGGGAAGTAKTPVPRVAPPGTVSINDLALFSRIQISVVGQDLFLRNLRRIDLAHHFVQIAAADSVSAGDQKHLVDARGKDVEIVIKIFGQGCQQMVIENAARAVELVLVCQDIHRIGEILRPGRKVIIGYGQAG